MTPETGTDSLQALVERLDATPRTDALCEAMEKDRRTIWEALEDMQAFARQLERELRSALAAMKKIRAETVEAWIPVGERLPEPPPDCVMEVIIATPDFVTAASFYEADKQFWADRGEHYERHYWETTHWMPLPKGPS